MTRLISIDPGKHYIGYATWYDNVLTDAGVLLVVSYENSSEFRLAESFFDDQAFDEVAIEVPRILYEKNVDHDDLVDIALSGGVALGMIGASKVTRYYPFDWKGQVKKTLGRERYLNALTDVERTRMVDGRGRLKKGLIKTLEHNAWDAIGIGLHHTGRRRRRL